MPVVLTSNAYGKANVRVTRVTRLTDRHELAEWTVDVELEGDFAAAYLHGDNRKVVATDTMKNRVYAIAADARLAEPEDFSLRYSADFLADYPQVSAVTMNVTVQSWQRIVSQGRPHPHAFVAGPAGERTCRIHRTRGDVSVSAGISGLPVLKTADSAFRDFHRDRFTTLPDTDERILATLLTARWSYAGNQHNWSESHGRIMARLLDVFAGHKSLGVQQTLYAMGEAVLNAEPAVREIELHMPNQHRIPFNLEPLGLKNTNSIFVTTSEPSGQISARLGRG